MARLLERYHDENSKLVYFLQGVAASAIAFALHETADRAPSRSLAVIGIAVVAWAISFGGGVLYWQSVQVAMKANIGLNMIDRGEAPSSMKERFNDQFDKYNDKAVNRYRVLTWGLLVGALFYSAGHVMHLYEAAAPKQVAAQPAQPASFDTNRS